MSNVVPFKAKEPPHLAGSAKCIGCAHEWEAVAPVGTVSLECPSCSSERGVWRYPVRATEGDSLFLCNCGCEALTAYHRAGKFWLKCMCCGVDHTKAVFG